MANVTFNKKAIEKEFKITEENLDKIMMMGIPVERVTENEIEIQVLPNRPDLISQQGFIRAFKAYLGKSVGLSKYRLKKSGETINVDKSVPAEWPYALACIVKGLTFNKEKIKEIIDIQEKLGATLLRKRKKGGLGLYPLQKITFPVKFIGRSPDEINFRPLEHDKSISGRQILQQHPTGREYASICQDWKKLPIFIDKKNEILSMPPIINSHDLGRIDETTKELFIEVTGTDLNAITKALNIVVTALADMGGTIYTIDCIQSNGKKITAPDLTPEKMKISPEEVNIRLGTELKEKDLEKLLPRMGYDYVKNTVLVPPWRIDVIHPVDIIEDIAIAYGYDNIIPKLPAIATTGEETQLSKLTSHIANILIGLGFIETSSYHLIKKEETNYLKSEEKIEVENSKTEYKFLRPNLTIPTLRTFAENKDNEYPQKIFEMGTVFSSGANTPTTIGEAQNLIIASSPGSFTEQKQILDYITQMMGIRYTLQEATKKEYAEGRTAQIIINNNPVGYIGEIHPETIISWNLKMPVAIIEISLNSLYS